MERGNFLDGFDDDLKQDSELKLTSINFELLDIDSGDILDDSSFILEKLDRTEDVRQGHDAAEGDISGESDRFIELKLASEEESGER